jgi:MYXO-CTERM domain-containing protein
MLGRTLAWCLSAAMAADPIVIFSGEVRGGVAVDASGVSTPHNGTSTYFAGPDFVVNAPATAVVEEVWLVLVSKNGGFPDAPASEVLVNGVSLAGAALVATGERFAVYSLDPVSFGITGPGDYAYEETASAEADLHDGAGIGGATLVVRYSEPEGRAHRRVAFLAGYGTAAGSTISLEGFSAPDVLHGGEIVVSVGLAWECADEQDGELALNGRTLTVAAGGRDDGGAPSTACTGDWNSLWTQGSFGADDDGLIVGVDGDSLDFEPGEGLRSNSRLSDELWRTPFGAESDVVLDYSSPAADGWMGVVALSLDLDSDGDGVVDQEDDCTDLDGDGFGNAAFNPACTVDCDDGDAAVGGPKGYADRDLDGYGDRRDYVCVETPGYIDDDRDCDDTRADVHPGALEVCDADDTDEDCKGLADNDDPAAGGQTDWYVDADADGYGDPNTLVPACDARPGAWSADDTDCDDTRADVHPGALEVCDDADVDEDCDGLSDDDDPDTTAEQFWYRDEDGDGYGNPRAVRTACDNDPGEVEDRRDCDDSDPDIHPGAPDALFDGVDSDCNGDDAPAPDNPEGCGCGTANGSGATGRGVGLVALAALRRRRRSLGRASAAPVSGSCW